MARFLVVDDDPASVSGLKLLLHEDGHEVAGFTKGADAIEALATGRFDVVVADLEMPVVDGHAVARTAREAHPDACLVAVTARPDEKLQELHAAGVCVVADKPFDYDEVMRVIADCRGHGKPGEPARCQRRHRPHGLTVVSLRRK